MYPSTSGTDFHFSFRLPFPAFEIDTMDVFLGSTFTVIFFVTASYCSVAPAVIVMVALPTFFAVIFPSDETLTI